MSSALFDRIFCSSRFGAAVVILILAASGCSTQTQSSPNIPTAMAHEMGLGYSSSDDAWPTFAYDNTRSGYNPNVTNITKKTVSSLKLNWQQSLGDNIYASPVTYGGNLIVVTEGSFSGSPGSVVYDLSTTDGHIIWQFPLGHESKMSPAIDPDAGLVFVGRQGRSSYLYALSLLNGSVVWHASVGPGYIRAAPVVAGGWVYIGRAGGDPPHCDQGGISAYNETTGALGWSWNVDPNPKEGGSVWGAIAYDGAHLIFGTGNTCQEPITTANGAVSLDLSGHPIWNMVAVKDSHYDSDSGGGVMLFKGLAHFINKNGRFYALHNATGNIKWKSDLNPYAQKPSWNGGFASPTTDGTTIVEGAGLFKGTGSGSGSDRELCMLNAVRPDEYFKGFHSELDGMNLKGKVLWSITMRNRLVGYVALAGGMGFVGLNQEFVALDLSTGKKLWSYATPDYINASMIVVPSGLYGADEAGNVYGFSLPSNK